MKQDKRELRQFKRELKQAGNQRRRRLLRRELAENPEEAQYFEPDYGKLSSETMNDIDRRSGA